MTEDTVTEQVGSRWFIDLDWYQQSNRSFSALAQSCLCPECRERLKEGEISPENLFTTIKDCCSQTPDFIADNLPILERIFRLFLANGNHPLDLEELGEQLRKWHSGIYPISTEVLSRLLEGDQYYGLRQTSS